MKYFKITVVLMCAVALASCTEKRAKDFLSSFASAVEMDQVSNVAVMYPQVSSYGDLSYNLFALRDPELQVTKEKGEGDIGLIASDGTKIILAKGPGKSFYIIHSYGLVNVDPKYRDFALNTGWIENGLDDADIQRRLSDRQFLQWVSADFVKSLKKKVSVRVTPKGLDNYNMRSDEGDFRYEGIYVTVSNRSNYDLPAEAYTALAMRWLGGIDDLEKFPCRSLPIKAKGSMTVKSPCPTDATWDYTYESDIIFNEEVLCDLFLNNYVPSGNEYTRFLSTRSGL